MKKRIQLFAKLWIVAEATTIRLAAFSLSFMEMLVIIPPSPPSQQE